MIYPYILVVLMEACGGANRAQTYQTLSMQEFSSAQACQFASLEVKKLSYRAVRAVCIPKGTK